MMTLTLNETEWAAIEDLSYFPELGIKVLVEGEFQWVDTTLLEDAWFLQGENPLESLYSRGEILLTGDKAKLFSYEEYFQTDSEVQIHFRISPDFDWHHRFTLFVDERGVRWEQGAEPGMRIGLYDLSGLMEASEERGEWEEQAVYLEMKVCDKSKPDESLVHQIARRWDIPDEEVDCSLVEWNIPYARLTRNDWNELSELAFAYGAHLECGAEKRIIFAYSSFQEEENQCNENGFLFRASHIYAMTTEIAGERFSNDVRLKWHRTVRGEHQQIWKYDDAPVVYGEDLKPAYPFLNYGNLRDIQILDQDYIAEYRVIIGGQRLPMIHAVEVDDSVTVTARMENSGVIELQDYDRETTPDSALLHLVCEEPGNLENLDIWGTPYYQQLNCCCYRKDQASINQWGRRVRNITGAYFTQEKKDGVIQCEKWVEERLTRFGKPRKRYRMKTEMPLFPWKPHCRVQIEGTLRGTKDSGYARVEEVYLNWKRGGLMKNRIVLLEEAP